MLPYIAIVLAACALHCSIHRVEGNTLVFRFSQENGLKDKFQQTSETGHLSFRDPVAVEKPKKCGYQACDLGKADMLNVHLVPHTHDDVGWLKTVDQYYYGAKNNIQHAGVQYILDTVMEALQFDKSKRFIYVEIAFFYRWWNQQHDSVRHLVKSLVNQGRLEFILGGWCMNDEASTHYNAIIDQHTVGFRFLQDNFGECARPKIGWQIDPFGHSREQASLFAQFGFDGLFFGRLDYQDKLERLSKKTMELMWMGSANLGDGGALFTGVNYNMYQPPLGFCFDQWCTDAPIMDDERLEEYNVEEKVKDFLEVAHDQAKHYTTNHIMMTMGSDFQFENAAENFKNLDKLLYHVNAKQKTGNKVNLLYSTPSCYLYALNKANQTYTVKTDDFFPYANRPHTFWTGYFTSRPTLKAYVRSSNNFLQICKQLDALSLLEDEFGSDLKIGVLRHAMGVAQHHDAVSGTEKQAVADDYALRLARGVANCEEVVLYSLGSVLPLSGKSEPLVRTFCRLLNASYCPTTEKQKSFTVVAYNPIGRPVDFWVRIPVTRSSYQVTDPSSKSLPSQVVPISTETGNLPDHQGSRATGELYFKTQLPPLGLKTFFVQTQSASVKEQMGESTMTYPQTGGDFTIKNQFLSLTFDGSTGVLKSMTNTESALAVCLQQSLLYYKAFAGDNIFPATQASGAYAFRPNGSDAEVISTKVKSYQVQGKLVQEVRQVFSDWASQVIRLYEGERYAEFEWTVGPIPCGDGIGKEVISRFQTDLDSEATFYTDSNGREMLKRIRDYRPTWKFNQTEEIAGNYYPVNSRIYIRDTKKNTQFTVLTDRSQGGASIKDGEIELMVHRRLFYDDAFGVGEPLNETGITGKGLVARGKHYVFLDTIGNSSRLHRDLGERLFMAPSLSFSSGMNRAKYQKRYRLQWSGLRKALPDNVHLLTLEQWRRDTYLLRLEHFYEKDEYLSKPAIVSLKGLFETFEITALEELTLGANQKLKDAKRLRWNVKNAGKTKEDMWGFVEPVDPSTLEVKLSPMQIRTFQISIKPREMTK